MNTLMYSLTGFLTGYIVEKKGKRGDWVKANVFPVPDTTFSVFGETEGAIMEYRVCAVNDGGPGKPTKATPPHEVRDPVCKYFNV